MSRFIVPVVFILISIGLFFGYINGTYEEIKELRVQDEEFSKALTQARELEEIQIQLRSRYNTFATEDLERLKKLLPDNVDNVRLILDIDSIAERHGIQVENLELEEGQRQVVIGSQGRPYEVAKMSFGVSASYEEFLAFMEDLEASLRIIDVVSLSFNSSETGLYGYNVGIQTYWLR